MAEPLKFLMQSQVLCSGERSQEKQTVFSTMGYVRSQGGIAGIRGARLWKGGSEIQPSAFLPAARCCLC